MSQPNGPARSYNHLHTPRKYIAGQTALQRLLGLELSLGVQPGSNRVGQSLLDDD